MMIKKAHARVFSFDLQFRGSKRTSFYRKLFGYRSRVKREDSEGRTRVYENFYPGLLTPIPHLKLGRSVFAVPERAADKVSEFFQDSKWRPINLHAFTGILPPEDRMRAMEETLDRRKLVLGEDLRSEIKSLREIASQGRLNSTDLHRARRVLKAVDELTELDWTDEKKFSRNLQERITPIREAVKT